MDYSIDGIRYYVDTWGNGFPLVLLHGFTGDHSTWGNIGDNWKTHSRIIAPDLIGHGKTDAPENIDPYNIETAASVIDSLMEEMDIQKADILGYSMGGRLAITFAIKYPHRVRRLILESTSPGLETEEEREARRKQDEKLSEFIRMNGITGFVGYWEEIPLFQSQKNLSKLTRSKIREQRLKNTQIGLINSLKGMGTGSQPSWWQELEHIEVPVLILTGELDRKFCYIAERMGKRLKNCRWISIENSGHAIHVEKPEKFGTIVSEFLSQSDQNE